QTSEALSGEGALMAALAAGRTGHMSDIVATIQAEQDRIIRSDLAGPLVVQGGPGTGKTAVALHRAAFLLYSHRARLASSGVLIVGPSNLFLRYIDRVLPSLGETGVVATTMAELIPGLKAKVTEQPAVAIVKGHKTMAEVIRQAVLERQRLPKNDLPLMVLGRQLILRRKDVKAAADLARQTGKPHNQARTTFVREMLNRLTDQAASRMSRQLTSEDRVELTEDLRSAPAVRTWINLCWMPIGPEHLLRDLFAKDYLLEHCARTLSSNQRQLLRRPANAPWTTSDIPLLDEAAELLGEDQTAALAERRHAALAMHRDLEYASEVLNMHGVTRLTPEQLTYRFAEHGPALTIAEQARRDRAWTYGHIVVDEAQELTAMDWRCLLRRCPSRSLTIVGDAGQARHPGASGSWDQSLNPALGVGGWRSQTLTVNYRTPGAVVKMAQAIARQAGLPVGQDWAAREVAGALEIIKTKDPISRSVELATKLAPTRGRGRLAVVCSARTMTKVRVGIAQSSLASQTAPDGQNPLDYPVALLSAEQTKGLEFDTVIIVEPSEIFSQSGSGAARRAAAADLYVAMTRPTTKLCLVHRRPLPPTGDGSPSCA
ncbi:MAG: AAA family ATPase, partial [Micrococcales bacterium]|nr:AAA family ATPase [Micrococcales bacterium]